MPPRTPMAWRCRGDHGKVGYVGAFGIPTPRATVPPTHHVRPSLTNGLPYTVMQLAIKAVSNSTRHQRRPRQTASRIRSRPVFPKIRPIKTSPTIPWQKITRACVSPTPRFSNFWLSSLTRSCTFTSIRHHTLLRRRNDPLAICIEHGRTSQGLGLDVGDLTKADFQKLA